MKKIRIIVSVLVMALILALPVAKLSAAGSIGVSVSSSSIKIGDKVTVTVSIPQGYMSGIILTYDPAVLSFVSCSTESSGGRGDVQFSIYNATTATVTFNAVAEGSSTISASVNSNIGACDENGNDTTLSGASAKVTVANQASGGGGSTTKSADNSLSQLKISSGTLSPSFKYNVTNYTATVDYSVTSVAVTAIPSHAKATVESVTGNSNLQVGENTISIVVKAENGVTATYRIVVTRLAQSTGGTTEPENPDEGNTQEPEEPTEKELSFEYTGQKLIVAESIPAEVVPADFSLTTMQVSGQEVQAASFSKGDVTLLYLENEEGYSTWYVYDSKEKNIYPFVKLTSEKGYVIVLRPDVGMALDGFKECTLSVEGKGTVIAYQAEGDNVNYTDFYLVYCANSSGDIDWYMYDSVEGTYQRYVVLDVEGDETDKTDSKEVDKLEKENAELKDSLVSAQIMNLVLLGVVLVVIIAAIVVIIMMVRKKDTTGNGPDGPEGTQYVESDDKVDEDESAPMDNLEDGNTKIIGKIFYEESNNETTDIKAEEAARANAEMFMADMESKNVEPQNEIVPDAKAQETEPQVEVTKKEDDFDVEVSPAEDFPSEEDYQDEDLTIINL